MKQFYTPDSSIWSLGLGADGAAVKIADQSSSWLITHLGRLSRNTELRAGFLVAHGPADGERASLLRDASVHLDAAAAIYRLLLDRSCEDTISLSDCLGAACAAVLEPLDLAARVSFEFYCEPGCTIPAAQAFPIAAIAVEALINALRHAHPSGVRGSLSMACRRKGDEIVVEVADDGVGLPEGFDLGHDAGVGLASAARMANDIGAEIALEQRPLGLTLRLTINADAASAAEGCR